MKEHIEIQRARVEAGRGQIDKVNEKFNLSEKSWVPVDWDYLKFKYYYKGPIKFYHLYNIIKSLMNNIGSSVKDFTLLSVIGKGTYAKVLLVRSKKDNQVYAMKSLKKKYII